MRQQSAVGTSPQGIAVSGAAGFIGFHLVRKLLATGATIGWAGDSLKPSYGGNLSAIRAASLTPALEIDTVDLLDLDPSELATRLSGNRFLVHLAASPGVRAGERDPLRTFRDNVEAFQVVLAAAELAGLEAVFFASSSSVYGDEGVKGACSEIQANGIQMKSWYATTKWINEIQARDFSRRTGIPTVALRFFTVYGSYGRPDMAYFSFAEAIKSQTPITIYGSDGGSRDFTHVSDTVHAISDLLNLAADRGPEVLPQAVNIATGRPTSTMQLVRELAVNMGVPEPKVEHQTRPNVDAEATFADTELLESLIGSWDVVNLAEGLREFVDWWKSRATNADA